MLSVANLVSGIHTQKGEYVDLIFRAALLFTCGAMWWDIWKPDQKTSGCSLSQAAMIFHSTG